MLTVLCFLILGTSFVFASGKKDNTLKDVDLLIDQKNYNAALPLLQVYIVENPEDFDNAQKRINKITDARSGYAKLADDLIDVIVNEPTNDEKKLSMIAELEAMEKNPTAATRRFIAETRAASEFTFFKYKFEELIEKGSEETQNGQYIASLRTNYEGFQLYRTTFYEQGYDEDLTTQVDNELLNITNAIEQCDLLQSRLSLLFNQFEQNLTATSYTEASLTFQSIQTVMTEYANIRNSIAVSGAFFRDSFADLQTKYPDLTEASFLAFAYRFVLGRTSTPDSGMVAAIDTQWNRLIENAKKQVLVASKKILEKNNILFTANTVDSLVSSELILKNDVQLAGNFLSLAVDVNALYSFLNPLQDETPIFEYPEYLASISYGQSLLSNILSEFQQSKDYVASKDRIANFVIPQQPSTVISSGDIVYDTFVLQEVSNLTAIQTNSLQLNNQIKQNIVNDSETWQFTVDLIVSLCTTTELLSNSAINELWQSYASWVTDGCGIITEFYEKNYEESVVMLNEELSPDIKSLPTELIVKMRNSLTQLALDRQNFVRIENQLSSVESNSVTKEFVTSCIRRLDQVVVVGNQLIGSAQQRVLLAERAKNEADLRYSEALAALKKNDFDAARDYLQRSRTRYSESLQYQFSFALEESTDSKLVTLGDDITRAENELIVREVRELKTQARNAYYTGNFDQAELLLTQAKTRWAVTNVEEDSEINSLMTLVGTALSMKTGRVISPSAPLFPEMSQILSIANQYFDEGTKLMAAGKRQEATEILNVAKQKLRELQLVYPLNQEAGILTLKIDQLIDPVSFATFFAQKVENAKRDYQSSALQQEGYADLLDLYEINPKYSGLANLIYQVEIALGIRVIPPDTSSQRESVRLTAQASEIYNSSSRTEITLTRALALVNDALEKNPDNSEAQVLKDRINTALGGTRVAVLPAEAESSYQKAVQEFQKGNTLQAYAIITQLMQNSSYKNSAKLIDLEKRIKAAL